MAEAVDGGGVDPVDAGVECAENGLDGVLVFLGAPGVLPVAAADGPGAEADGRQVQIGVAELTRGAKDWERLSVIDEELMDIWMQMGVAGLHG